MAHVIIDRRKTDKGKSTVNRQKFLERIRQVLKKSVRESVKNIDVKKIGESQKVVVPVKDLVEPSFEHAEGGVYHKIVTGNTKYVVGDRIPRKKEGEGKPKFGAPDGDGEDEFLFTLSKDEFLDFFFDNLELPDMMRKELALLEEEEIQRAGFRTDGPPSTLNIVRSMRQAKSRRFGLRSMKSKKLRASQKRIQELEDLIAQMVARGEDVSALVEELENLKREVEVLERRISSIPFIDTTDLRYNSWTRVPQPAVQAVMFCILDVSASMDELKKELAKSFFMLLYLFLQRNYDKVDIVFVRHHHMAEEVEEEDFFYARETGGTVVSSALELVVKIIRERYPLSAWNVYVAQGSDGDNFPDDNEVVRDILVNQLLPIVQYYAYVQINTEEDQIWRMSPMQNDPWNMWMMFHTLAKQHKNLDTAMLAEPKHIYSVFRKLFERRNK